MARSRSNRRVAAESRAVSFRRRRNMLMIGGLASTAAVVVIVVVILSAVQESSGSTSSSTTAGGSEGTPPNFEFTLYQGESRLGAEDLDFAQFQGQPIVLNFWAGLCPPCRAEMPGFQPFYDHSKEDVLLLGIDVGQFTGLGSKRDARNLLQELGVSYPAGFTDDGSVMRKYEVLGMPTTIFINSRGDIVENWTGPIDQQTLQRITDAILRSESRSAS